MASVRRVTWGWIIARLLAWFLLPIALWVGIIYTVVHFIVKYW